MRKQGDKQKSYYRALKPNRFYILYESDGAELPAYMLDNLHEVAAFFQKNEVCMRSIISKQKHGINGATRAPDGHTYYIVLWEENGEEVRTI